MSRFNFVRTSSHMWELPFPRIDINPANTTWFRNHYC
jgi:hypothetical protein